RDLLEEEAPGLDQRVLGLLLDLAAEERRVVDAHDLREERRKRLPVLRVELVDEPRHDRLDLGPLGGIDAHRPPSPARARPRTPRRTRGMVRAPSAVRSVVAGSVIAGVSAGNGSVPRDRGGAMSDAIETRA